MEIKTSRRSVILGALTLTALQQRAYAQDKIVLKMGTLGTTDYFYYKGAKRMADEAAQRSQNRIEIQVFPNQELGNEHDMIEGMQLGTIDLAVINTASLVNFDPRFMVFDMPFLFNDWAHVKKVFDGPIGKELLSVVEARDLKAFAFSTAGFRDILNNRRRVRTPNDLKGLKIRTLDNPVHVAIMNAMGANATPMQYDQVATALLQKTIDGLDFQIGSSATERMYETNKYMALTEHVFTGVVYMMGLKKYQALSPENQKIIADTAVIGAGTETDLYNKFEGEAAGILKEHGMIVDAVDKVPFRALTQSVYDRFQDKVGKDLIERIRLVGR